MSCKGNNFSGKCTTFAYFLKKLNNEPAFNVRQQSQVYIGSAAELLPELLPEGRVVVVSDATIDRLYHPLLAKYDTVLIGTGESFRPCRPSRPSTAASSNSGVDRATFVLGIGGGIVTDVAGFAASTYMRGLRFGFVRAISEWGRSTPRSAARTA